MHGLRAGLVHGARMNLTRYGILDDDGQLVRWTYDKPADGVMYLIEITKPLHEIDWDNFEEALL